MRPVIHTTLGQRTAYIIHRVMKEKKCKKSEALNHIVAEYERRNRAEHVDEAAERVIKRLKVEEK